MPQVEGGEKMAVRRNLFAGDPLPMFLQALESHMYEEIDGLSPEILLNVAQHSLCDYFRSRYSPMTPKIHDSPGEIRTGEPAKVSVEVPFSRGPRWVPGAQQRAWQGSPARRSTRKGRPISS
jgi:hypothetical protein